jgi:hypothetical protein
LISRVKGERIEIEDDGDEALISNSSDHVFKDYISSIEADIDSILFEEIGAG